MLFSLVICAIERCPNAWSTFHFQLHSLMSCTPLMSSWELKTMLLAVMYPMWLTSQSLFHISWNIPQIWLWWLHHRNSTLYFSPSFMATNDIPTFHTNRSKSHFQLDHCYIMLTLWLCQIKKSKMPRWSQGSPQKYSLRSVQPFLHDAERTDIWWMG